MKTYDEMKNTSLLEQNNEEEFIESPIQMYRNYVYNSTDSLELLLRKLELTNLSERSNILESAIAQDILESNISCKRETISSHIPSCVPYFTPEEIVSFTENTEFTEEYKRRCVTGLYDFDYSSQYSKVQELYKQYQSTPTVELEQEIISLGWNPSVEPNEDNMKIAVRRISKYIDENYDFDIIDLSEAKSPDIKTTSNPVLYPVFIVLSFTNTFFGKIINKAKHGNYSHASIAFEPDLKHLYTYNFDNKLNKGGGLSFESIQDYIKEFKDSRIKVLVVFVDGTAKAKIRAKLDYFISNVEKTRYDVTNLFRIVFDKAGSDLFNLKMICSQFVDAMLRAANIDLTHKSTNLVAPDDFEKVNNNKVFVVFEGFIRDYNPVAVSRKIKALSAKKSNQYKEVELKEAIDLILHNVDPFLYKSIRINNEATNEILDEIVDMVTAEPVIVEALKLPFSFHKNGDLEINFPDKLEEEYQKSHKLLLQYDEADDMEGMKNELAKLWYLNNIAERKMKGKKKDDTIKTRARILNDFKKYLGKVLDKEKNFNFTEYFNNSPYYDKSIKIDASTLHWSGRILKSLIVK